jgi:hypothetical protein
MNTDMKQQCRYFCHSKHKDKNQHFGRPFLTGKNSVDRRAGGDDARIAHEKSSTRAPQGRSKKKILLLFPLDTMKLSKFSRSN